ncbi:MAG TPA: hypothetical protein VNK96_09725 [Fimbriimonadales bacterium]|nr:hypothetical protein [Fimbriimonadales bacterium]
MKHSNSYIISTILLCVCISCASQQKEQVVLSDEDMRALRIAYLTTTSKFPISLDRITTPEEAKRFMKNIENPVDVIAFNYWAALRFGYADFIDGVAKASKMEMGLTREEDVKTPLPFALEKIFLQTGSERAIKHIVNLRLDGHPAEMLSTVRTRILFLAGFHVARVLEEICEGDIARLFDGNNGFTSDLVFYGRDKEDRKRLELFLNILIGLQDREALEGFECKEVTFLVNYLDKVFQEIEKKEYGNS